MYLHADLTHYDMTKYSTWIVLSDVNTIPKWRTAVILHSATVVITLPRIEGFGSNCVCMYKMSG